MIPYRTHSLRWGLCYSSEGGTIEDLTEFSSLICQEKLMHLMVFQKSEMRLILLTQTLRGMGSHFHVIIP